MSIFLTADEHYYHPNIIKYCDRPFESEYEMRETFIENNNNVVLHTDTVYHLGDFAWMNKNDTGAVQETLRRLNGVHVLVLGNHDKYGLPKYRKVGFAFASYGLQLQYGKEFFNLSHYPYARRQILRRGQLKRSQMVDDGRLLLHGHTHSKSMFGKYKNQINVGVDACNFAPVALDKIMQLRITQRKK